MKNVIVKDNKQRKQRLIMAYQQIVAGLARKTIQVRRLEKEIDGAIEAMASLEAQIEAEDATIN